MLALIAIAVAVVVAWRLGLRVASLERTVLAQKSAIEGLTRDVVDLRPGAKTEPAIPVPAELPKPVNPPIATAATVQGPGSVPPVAPPSPAVLAAGTPAAVAAVGPSFEERLGTRWAVWLGGAALALGGILMVLYSIEQGLFGPGVRLTFAGLFASALIATGEWIRRNDLQLDLGGVPSAHIPSILTAAGTVSMFGTIYAAHALYGFIGPAAAFVLLGAAGVATMVASALHGPALAGLGLAGALITPALIATPNPSPWPVVLYLAVVATSAYWLARARKWLWLATAVVAGAVIWGLLLLPPVHSDEASWTTALHLHTVLQLALAAVFMAIEPHAGTRDEAAVTDWIGSAALAALTGLVVAVLAATRFEAWNWVTFVVAAMVLLAGTGLRISPVAPAVMLAGIAAIAAAATWPGLKAPPDARLLWPAVADVMRVPDIVQSYLTFAALGAIAVSAAATWRLWRGRTLAPGPAGFYALAANLTPLAVLVVAYLRVTQFDRSYAFAAVAALLAGLLYLVADRFDRTDPAKTSPFVRFCIGCYASGCTAAAALAFAFALDRGYLTAAFAITAATTALFAVVDRIPALRHMVAAIGLVVLARLAWDPRIMGADIGQWPILNWLLVGYGAPALAFLGAGYLLKREKEDLASRLSDALGVLFAFLLVFFQIRHFLHAGDPLSPATGHVEQGLFATLGLGMSYVLARADLARGNVVFRLASMAFGLLTAVQAAFSLGLVENPWINRDIVGGGPVLSTLALAYLLPGAAAVLLARSVRGIRPAWFVNTIAVLALGLLFAYTTLETRHVFQGERIGFLRTTSAAEIWAYSAVWLALGLAALAYGIVRVSLPARIASAALIVLATLKVFLFDFSGITGFWRALSFMLLGLVLIGIGLVYQKWVFRRPPGAAAKTV